MVNTSLSVDIKYKAPNVGESLLMGIANGLGGCTSYGGYGSFGSLTGLGGYGMGCGGLTSDIGSILCGTAMNIAYGGFGGCGIGLGGYGGYGMGMYGMGGYGMGMYSFGGCSTDFALAQAGAQLGTGLAAIGMNAIDRLLSKSNSGVSNEYYKKATNEVNKDRKYKDNIDIAKKNLASLGAPLLAIKNAQTAIANLNTQKKNLETLKSQKPENDTTNYDSEIGKINEQIQQQKNLIHEQQQKVAKLNIPGLDISSDPSTWMSLAQAAITKAEQAREDAIKVKMQELIMASDKKKLEVTQT